MGIKTCYLYIVPSVRKYVQRGIKIPIYCSFKKIVILGFYAGKSHNLIRDFMEISTFFISKLSIVTVGTILEIKKS
jgi:hypothetical protein